MLNPRYFSQMSISFGSNTRRNSGSSGSSSENLSNSPDSSENTSNFTINNIFITPIRQTPATATSSFSTPHPERDNLAQSCSDLSLSRSNDPLYNNSNFTLTSPVFVRQLNSSVSMNPRILPYDLWEEDSEASDCHSCQKNFSLWVRRHHCRRCGLIYCDQCSSSRADLYEFSFHYDIMGASIREDNPPTPQRVCDSCDLIIRSGPRIPPVEVPVPLKRTDSQSSVLTECPVCSIRLITIGSTRNEQENHINSCLEGNSFDGSKNSSRYLVFTLAQDSPLIGQECTICMEEYLAGNRIARLNCLCCFHRSCIQEWFFRNSNCPVHFQ